ncbi:MAG: SIR2 family protein [Methanosarcina barkeri]|nr:SIR2 family protein [Methanosarcina sp. ERenArc_MAG2]
MEKVYSYLLNLMMTKKAVKIATRAAYDRIDEMLIEHQISNYTKWINTVNKLLLEFGKTNNRGFIFTLNQDLFIERFYRNPSRDPSRQFYNARLSIPGIDKYPMWFMSEEGNPFNGTPTEEEVKQFYTLKGDEYHTLPNKNEFNSKEGSLLKGSYFLIKLHGSYNWISSDGSDMMVIGRGKSKQIHKEPLLTYYYDLFKEVLSQDQRRLLVIGYGFGDEHINSILSEAVREHKLKIYILSPESPKSFKEKLCDGFEKSEDTIDIWKGVSGYFQCVENVLLKDVYGNQFEKEHFYNIFFGKNNCK